MNLELTFIVNKPIETVFDNLTDMQKFVSYHPIIDKIEFISGNNYCVHETLRLVFIPIAFRYLVEIISKPNEKSVEMNAIVFKLTKIKMNFVLKSIDGNTNVTEFICFKSLFPLNRIMRQIFKKQHSLLFENMNH